MIDVFEWLIEIGETELAGTIERTERKLAIENYSKEEISKLIEQTVVKFIELREEGYSREKTISIIENDVAKIIEAHK